MDFIGDATKRTRRGKPCPCEWCGQIIETGSAYYTYAQVWEGDFSHMRMHNECYEDGYKELDWQHYDNEFMTRDMQRGQPASQDDPILISNSSETKPPAAIGQECRRE